MSGQERDAGAQQQSTQRSGRVLQQLRESRDRRDAAHKAAVEHMCKLSRGVALTTGRHGDLVGRLMAAKEGRPGPPVNTSEDLRSVLAGCAARSPALRPNAPRLHTPELLAALPERSAEELAGLLEAADPALVGYFRQQMARDVWGERRDEAEAAFKEKFCKIIRIQASADTF